MHMLYDSDTFAVMAMQADPATQRVDNYEGPLLERNGFEIVDKQRGRQLYLDGSWAEMFQQQIQAWQQHTPTQEACLSRFALAFQWCGAYKTTFTMGWVLRVRYSSSSCSRLVAVIVIVTPKYFPPELSRSSTVVSSKSGSKLFATTTTALTSPSTRSPITLMGNLLGYSIKDSFTTCGPLPITRGMRGVGFGVSDMMG